VAQVLLDLGALGSGRLERFDTDDVHEGENLETVARGVRNKNVAPHHHYQSRMHDIDDFLVGELDPERMERPSANARAARMSSSVTPYSCWIFSNVMLPARPPIMRTMGTRVPRMTGWP
jgi:hypothetical protein